MRAPGFPCVCSAEPPCREACPALGDDGEVVIARSAIAARQHDIRVHALAFIDQHGRGFSREIRDYIQRVEHLRGLTYREVAAQLRFLQELGDLDSEIEPGPTLQRRYYRRKAAP